MLSVWDATCAADLSDLSGLSDSAKASASILRDKSFSSSVGFSQTSMNIDTRVLEALLALLILNQDPMRHPNQFLYSRRMTSVMQEIGLSDTDTKQWALECRSTVAAARPHPPQIDAAKP